MKLTQIIREAANPEYLAKFEEADALMKSKHEEFLQAAANPDVDSITLHKLRKEFESAMSTAAQWRRFAFKGTAGEAGSELETSPGKGSKAARRRGNLGLTTEGRSTMKLTKTKLTQLIKEELNKLFAEGRGGYDPYHTWEQEEQAAREADAQTAKMATGEPTTARATTAPAGSLKHGGVQADIDGNSVMFSVPADRDQRSAIAVPGELVAAVAERLAGAQLSGKSGPAPIGE
jgi:hypothetical protein